MSSVSTDQLFDDYLSRLRNAAGGLAPEQRQELVDEISEHLAAARAAGEADTEAGARNVLERLGTPESIVGAANPAGRPGGLVEERPSLWREGMAAFFLTIGSAIPVVGWIVGVVFLWLSKRIPLGLKIAATLIVPLGPFVLGGIVLSKSGANCAVPVSSSMFFSSAASCPRPWPAAVTGALLVLIYVTPFLLAILYLQVARKVAAQEPGRWVPAPVRKWGPVEVIAVVAFTAGWLIAPFACVFVGVVCTWVSKSWTQVEKRRATMLAALTFLPIVLFFLLIVPVRIGGF